MRHFLDGSFIVICPLHNICIGILIEFLVLRFNWDRILHSVTSYDDNALCAIHNNIVFHTRAPHLLLAQPIYVILKCTDEMMNMFRKQMTFNMFLLKMARFGHNINLSISPFIRLIDFVFFISLYSFSHKTIPFPNAHRPTKVGHWHFDFRIMHKGTKGFSFLFFSFFFDAFDLYIFDIRMRTRISRIFLGFFMSIFSLSLINSLINGLFETNEAILLEFLFCFWHQL